MESGNNGLTLKLVFKIAAVWSGIFALSCLAAADTVAATFGMEVTDDLVRQIHWMGIAMLCIAGLQWVIQMWAGDNLKNFGMVTALGWGLFGALGAYEFATGLQPTEVANLVLWGAGVVIAILLFVKSRE